MSIISFCREESKVFDESIQELVEKHEGEYVAIVGKEIVAYNRDAKKAYDMAKRRYPGKMVYIAEVPSREALIL